MTVSKLHKLLGKLIDKGMGRREVLVSKDTFTDNREADGCTLLPIEGLVTHAHTIMDGDSFTITNRDGSERIQVSVLLYGASGEPSTGLTFEATHPSGKPN